MKNINFGTKSKRFVDGNSSSDSLIRNNADTEDYVRYIVSLINDNLFNGENIVDYLLDEENLYLFHDNNEILNISQKYIDSFRNSGVMAFDKFLIDILAANGFEINRKNNYYVKLKREFM